MTDVRRPIDSDCRSTSDVDTFVVAFQATSTTRKAATLTSESATQDVCVVEVVNRIITQALRDRASHVRHRAAPPRPLRPPSVSHHQAL